MTPADIQSILNCINQFNRAVDYKQWEKLNSFFTSQLSIKFPKSSLLPTEKIQQSSFVHHLSTQLKDIKSMHRDYNFIFRNEGEIVCKSDFKIETLSPSNQLISSASGIHFYSMKKDGNTWKIAGIERLLTRVDAPVPQQNQVQYAYR